jgi:predicted DNA-binding transcriptional regulator YafY
MNFRKGDTVELIYIDDENKVSQRHVKVIAVKGEKVLAYCYTKRGFRSFSTENILGTKKVRPA